MKLLMSLLATATAQSGVLPDDLEAKLNYNPICPEVDAKWGVICEQRALTKGEECKSACADDKCQAECDTKLEADILLCPCRQMCFTGCPCSSMDCRTMADPVEDIKSIKPAGPSGNNLHLYWSDEFTSDGNRWQEFNCNFCGSNSAEVSDGVLKMKYNKNAQGNYKGHRRQFKWERTGPRPIQSVPVFGYWEASIRVDPERKGRSCLFYVIPDSYNLNPDNSTTDTTAAKGARIDIMSNAVGTNGRYKTLIAYNDLTSTVNVAKEHDAPGMDDGQFHTFGLHWQKDKLTWYYDGEVVREETNPTRIPTQYPQYPRLEASIMKWLGSSGGNHGGDETDNWPATCDVDYVRFFAEDQVNDKCHDLDKDEQTKCEAHYLGIHGQGPEYERAIADNCPCHINCYRGCGNCGTWECAGREFIDSETPNAAEIQPDGIGNHFDGGRDTQFQLAWSDEFNGQMLNSNKWHIRDEAGKVRTNYWPDGDWTNFGWQGWTDVYTYYEPEKNYLENGNLVQRWDRKPPAAGSNGNPTFHSGRIDTKGLNAPVYGWFEARMDTVPTNGIMSAWWMWPENGTWDYRQSECPANRNAWWGSEIDIIEARKKGDWCSTNIHYGGYKENDNHCYNNNHTDEPVPGLHDGMHTLGLRWSDVNGGRLEWFYDGELIRTLDDPLLVSRAATNFIISAEVFTDPDEPDVDWGFVDGSALWIPEDEFPFFHYFDYVRVWKEVPKAECPTGQISVAGRCVVDPATLTTTEAPTTPACNADKCGNNGSGVDENCKCICNPGFMPTTNGNGCILSDETRCEDKPEDQIETCCQLEENAVAHRFNRNRVTINRRSDDGYTLRVRFSQTSENIAYSPIVAFGVKDCGGDFINKLNNGEITVAMMDSHKSYVMKGQTHGQSGQHRNVLFQFEHTPCGEGLNCLGNQNVDQADLVLIGTGKANMGSKDIEEKCLKRTKIGHIGAAREHELATEDKTFCLSWVQKFW